jgi:hypothetical protein
MPSPGISRALVGVAVTLLTLSAPAFFPRVSAQTDLDAFMKDVVVRRDDNWKKLQQYILDEREETTFTGPGGARLWGEQRDYTWYIRDGFFVRSPIKFNGAAISEPERKKAEDEYLRRAKLRDARGGPEAAQVGTGGGILDDTDAPTSVEGLIRQSRQPQFVSSSYFLRFKFDEGTYALAGRETFEGRDVLRVEYYPTKLFDGEGRRGRRGRGGEVKPANPKVERQTAELRRLLNKVAIVTLWIEPASKQIVKYTFDNVDFDFLPVPWLLKIDSFKASMTMSQAFPEVWLPRGLEFRAVLTMAIGQYDLRQAISYHDYREANVTSKVIIPGAR